MAILLIIAALILICVIVLLIARSGRARRTTAPDRFSDIGPGEPRPKKPRATGPD